MKRLSLVVCLAAMTGPAAGQTPSTENAVFVGGTPIMRVRVAAGGYAPEQRAAQIQERVNRLLGQGPIRPEDITVRPIGSEAAVMVRDQLLFTADWATARFNRTTPRALAEIWAERMRGVLPSLTQPK